MSTWFGCIALVQQGPQRKCLGRKNKRERERERNGEVCPLTVFSVSQRVSQGKRKKKKRKMTSKRFFSWEEI